MAVASSDPVATILESLEIAKDIIALVCPSNFLKTFLKLKSHIIAVLSRDPVTKNYESGEKATDMTKYE